MVLTPLATAAVPQQRQRPTLEIELRAADGGPVGHAGIHVLHMDLSLPFAPRRIGWHPGDSPTTWSLPRAPFKVRVQTPDFFLWEREGLDPQTLGGSPGHRVLPVELIRRPRVRGRVVCHAGMPLGARVWLEAQPPLALSAAKYALSPLEGQWLRIGAGATTVASDGSFDLPSRGTGAYRIMVWSPRFGFGEGPDLGDLSKDAKGLVVKLEEPLATIEGRVRVPVGQRADDLMLRVPGVAGWWPVARDGSYLVRGVRPGRRVLQMRGRHGEERRPVGEAAYWSHGPIEGPAWLTSETAIELDLVAGQRRLLDIDLRRPAPCQLSGRLKVPFALPDREHGDIAARGPRVTLERRETPGYAARTDLDDMGRFALSVHQPGRYRLRIDLEREGGPGIVIDEWLDLRPGERDWSLQLEIGAVDVHDADGVRVPYRQVNAPARRLPLVWRAEGRELLIRAFMRPARIDALSAEEILALGPLFPCVPTGPAQMMAEAPDERLPDAGAGGRSLGEVRVRPGEQSVLKLAR